MRLNKRSRARNAATASPGLDVFLFLLPSMKLLSFWLLNIKIIFEDYTSYHIKILCDLGYVELYN